MADLFPRNSRYLIAKTIESWDLRAMLVDDTYAASETHTYLDNGGASDPVDKEITSSGYARQALANVALVNDGTRVKLTADNLAFGSIAIGAQQPGAVILYKWVTNVADSPVLAVFDTNDLPTNGGPITFPMPANGYLNF